MSTGSIFDRIPNESAEERFTEIVKTETFRMDPGPTRSPAPSHFCCREPLVSCRHRTENIDRSPNQ